jgi:uncharacterized secreted protein with C-terminal beta-propeller domain
MFQSHGSRCFSILWILITLSAISACSNSGDTPPANQPAVSARLVKPADNGELERWLKAELVKSYQFRELRYYYATMGSTGTAGGVTTAPTAVGVTTASTYGSDAGTTTTPQASGSGAADTYSSTNVQEKGVDEGDLVKTDGNYIYLARGSRFLVLKAQTVDQAAAVVSDIDLKEPISELHLAGNRVTVITAPYNVVAMASGTLPAVGVPGTSPAVVAPGGTGAAPPVGISAPLTSSVMPGLSITRVYNYDISTPTVPALLSSFDFPGSLQGSRRINNTIYLITNHRIDLPSPVSAWDYLPAGSYSMEFYSQASAMASAENLRRIDALTLAEMIPSYSRTIYTGGVAGPASDTPVVASGDIYIPESGNGTDLSLVIALDIAAADPVVTSSGVISSWCRIYMSPESLYLASSNNWAWIEPVQGMAQPAVNPEPWTALHKFALANGVGAPLYKGSGVVTGWLNDQFSMGEYNGYLRIGTTRGGWWGEGTSNRLAILSEENGALVEKGRIEGVAQGEKIYSMRFDRDRGYMVTFRQTDPLFTFDLSDPLNPRKEGELKVNGFATYIHLLGQDNNRLLTVGRSADATGRVTGNKLQLFDVTNLAAPTLLGDFELGDGWSTALYDYHAFLYYEPLGILAIPYYSYGGTSGLYSSGLRVFTINGSGITPRGAGLIPSQAVSSGYGSYDDTVDRSVIIGTDIYAIAHRTVTVADADQLNIKNVVALPEGYNYYTIAGQGGIVPAAAP